MLNTPVKQDATSEMIFNVFFGGLFAIMIIAIIQLVVVMICLF